MSDLDAVIREAVADAVRETLEAMRDAGELGGPQPVADEPTSWRERLWSCHPECRLNVNELAEALGRPRSAVYKLTSAGAIPHRKDLSGGLVFVAGQVRAWIRANESPVVEGESWTPGARPHLKAS